MSRVFAPSRCRLALVAVVAAGAPALAAPSFLLASPARALPAAEIREVPRTQHVIRRDIASAEHETAALRNEMEKLARRWAKSDERDPQSEDAMRMQGARRQLEILDARIRGLRTELREAEDAPGLPELAELRLAIAKQGSLVEESRRRLLLARTAQEVDAAERDLETARTEYESLRARLFSRAEELRRD